MLAAGEFCVSLKSMYSQHHSKILNKLFGNKPFQGANPDLAEFLFIGLDANYSPDIESSPIFPQLCEYHSDGVSFWKKYGVHHPFLLPEYSGDGLHYHRSFARIGFTSAHAQLVSFIELLHLPTTGRNKLTTTDLNFDHLNNINGSIINGVAKHIFISSGVVRLMKSTKLFSWLTEARTDNTCKFKVLFKEKNKHVYQHLHFSTYGKYEQQKQLEARAIYELLQHAG